MIVCLAPIHLIVRDPFLAPMNAKLFFYPFFTLNGPSSHVSSKEKKVKGAAHDDDGDFRVGLFLLPKRVIFISALKQDVDGRGRERYDTTLQFTLNAPAISERVVNLTAR